MAASAIFFLVKNLSTLIQNEVGLLWGVDKEMEKLKSTLSTILAVLDDAEMKQYREKAIQDWLRKLKDVSYQVSDLLDECQTETRKWEINLQSSGHLKKVWTSAITHYPVLDVLFCRKIANRIKDINEHVETIVKERKNFDLHERSIEKGLTPADDSRESSSLPPLEVLGRQDDKEHIVKVLIQDVCESKELSVYPILGMGGIGKTTLAQMTYNDERVRSYFVPRIWVYVSQTFDAKRVMKQIIESTSGKPSEASSLDCLHQKAREMLSGRKYLLVLDDAWSEDQDEWDKLKHVLACGLPGSCVVVTTRSEKVTSIIRTLPIHRLSFLSDDDCWLLFRQRAFGPGNNKLPDLVAIGKEIVKKCGGVPLAAKALGGLMRFRSGEKEWNYVKESDLWNIPAGECSVLPALRLSYYNLPLELRPCFSYCAIFPKGSQIEKDKLIQHWMANGFILSNGSLQVEDVGNMICNELYMRSIFQNEEKDWRGRRSFKMHDLIHDLAQYVMDDECHIMEAESSGSVPKRGIRHVTLVNNLKHDVAFPKALNGHQSLHTIMLQHRVPEYKNYISKSEFCCKFKNFGSLRVLDANGARIGHLSDSVGKSRHLRYLNLSGTDISELPPSIYNLHNLQTLNLNYCSSLRRLPKNIKYLKELRHVCLLQCDRIEETPPELEKLTQLKTLSVFVVGERSGQHLKELQHLDLGGELHIKHLERVRNSAEAKEANLAGKPNLRILKLSWEREEEANGSRSAAVDQQQLIDALEPHPNIEKLTIDDYTGKELPVWMRNPLVLRNVASIKLWDCNSCVRLPPLWQLPRLKCLRIWKMEKVEYLIQKGGCDIVTSVEAFMSLEKLEIGRLPNLKGLTSMEEEEEEGRMQLLLPCLWKMKITGCPKLILPTLPALKDLDITCRSLAPLWVKEESSVLLLTSISKLTSLTSLTLRCSLELIYFPEEMLQNLLLLQNLCIIEFPKLKVLPESISSLVALKSLKVEQCDDLECLPEGIGSLRSIIKMKIHDCPKIVSLPDSIQTLTQLEILIIGMASPELERRCEKGEGEDWYKIAHVPYVSDNYYAEEELELEGIKIM